MLLFNSCEYFYHAARLGNLTAAANEINISQSALSKAILKLESELDCQLFFSKSPRRAAYSGGRDSL